MPRPVLNRARHSPLTLLLLGGLFAGLISGCGGSSEPFAFKKITGKVTYNDGSLIQAARIRVIFVPENMDKPLEDGKTYPKPGNAEVNVADGTFDSVTTHLAGDGVIPGKMKVQIIAMDAQEKVLPVVPPKYGDPKTTPLEVDTSTGTDFPLKIDKPGAAAGK